MARRTATTRSMPVFDQHLAYSYFKKKSLTSIRRLRTHTLTGSREKKQEEKKEEETIGSVGRAISHHHRYFISSF